MLNTMNKTMAMLFAQLGLESSEDGIENFIASHQVDCSLPLKDATFWNASQKAFLQDAWEHDASWSDVVDELNVRLSLC